MATGTNAPPIKCRLKNWWQNHGIAHLAKELFGDAEGSHATPSEVAVTQFAYPDAIKSAILDPQVAPRGDFADAADYRGKFPDGRIGSNPALATPEAGQRLYEAAVAAISKDYLNWMARHQGARLTRPATARGSGARRKRPGRNNPATATNPAQPARISHSGAKLPAPS